MPIIKISLILFVCKLKIGCSKKNKQNFFVKPVLPLNQHFSQRDGKIKNNTNVYVYSSVPKFLSHSFLSPERKSKMRLA